MSNTRILVAPGAFAACFPPLPAGQGVTLHGKEGRSVTASAPRSLEIRRGDVSTLAIGIDRRDFTGPVTVTLFQLPRGVEPDSPSVVAGTVAATFILTASRSAALVVHQSVGVTVEGPDGYQATQFVNLTVTE